MTCAGIGLSAALSKGRLKPQKLHCLGFATQIETSVDLMEIDMGAWSGVTRADIATERQACFGGF